MPETVVYTQAEQQLVDTLHNSSLTHEEIWNGSVKTAGVIRKDRDDLKIKIKSKLKEIQGGYCIYCGFSFKHRCGERGDKAIERDHVAPKSEYKKFTFEAKNIVLACDICNSSDYKGKLDTIETYNDDYSNCTFNIVHPYIDTWSEHLVVNDDGTVSTRNESRKGLLTKTTFGLNEAYNIELRRFSNICKMYNIDDIYEAIISNAINSNITAI